MNKRIFDNVYIIANQFNLDKIIPELENRGGRKSKDLKMCKEYIYFINPEGYIKCCDRYSECFKFIKYFCEEIIIPIVFTKEEISKIIGIPVELFIIK